MTEPASIVVIGGLFVSRPELDDVVDVVVLVVADPQSQAEAGVAPLRYRSMP